MISPHAKIMRDAARYYGLKFKKFDPQGVLHLVSDGKIQFYLDRSATEKTSRISYILADNKKMTNDVLRKFKINVPKQKMVTRYSEVIDFFRKNKPVVIKPNKCSLGKGVTVGVNTQKKLKQAFDFAQKYDKRVLAETYIQGEDYRFTVINYEKVFVVKRIPAFVVGDGKNNIENLIEIKNKIKKKYKKSIKINDTTIEILNKQGLKLNDIPKVDKIVYLRKAANIAEGGTSYDFTDIASKFLIDMAKNVCSALKIPVAGIDIITEDISSDKGTVIEVNPRPHIILHRYPHEGQERYPAREIFKMLYGKNLKPKK